ncbi:unnamed protein product [Caenorhabditis brenneri]
MKTIIKVTSPNNMNQISQSQSDEVSGDVPVEDAPTTIARKIDPETTVADNLDKTSYYEICGQIRMTPICDQAAATSPVGCHTDPITIASESLAAPSKDTTSNLIRRAKEDKSIAARIRMEAYLAKKGESMKKTNPAKLDKPTSGSAFTVTRQTELLSPVADSLDIPNRERIWQKKRFQKKPVINIAKSGEKAPAELTEASKDDSVLDPTALSTAGSSNCSSKNAVQGQVSPAKCDEIEAARIRMEAYLAKKIGSKKK